MHFVADVVQKTHDASCLKIPSLGVIDCSSRTWNMSFDGVLLFPSPSATEVLFIFIFFLIDLSCVHLHSFLPGVLDAGHSPTSCGAASKKLYPSSLINFTCHRRVCLILRKWSSTTMRRENHSVGHGGFTGEIQLRFWVYLFIYLRFLSFDIALN